MNQDEKVKFGSFLRDVNLETIQKRKPHFNGVDFVSVFLLHKNGKTKASGSAKYKICIRFESIFNYVQQWKQKGP